jgi:hypothetical protein
MKINCKTLKEWEDFGLLAELPEDRKEMVVFCYNIAVKWITDGLLVTDNDKMTEIEQLILPLLYRIAKIVDLTETEVLETCKEFQQSWLTEKVKVDEYNMVIDFEMMFIAKFAEMKINEIKNK